MFEGFKQFFKREKIQDLESSKPTGYEVGHYGYGYQEGLTNKQYLESMSGWVSSCVTSISDKVASTQLRLYRLKGDEIEEVTEHDILDVLYKVNSFTTKFDHFWLTQAYLELTGEAPWYLDKNGKNVNGIYLIRPDRIIPIPGNQSKEQIVDHYLYDIGNGKRIKLASDEVIFLKYPNPANPFRGVGTLEQAARTVDIDNASERWNFNFYENAAKPNAVITVPGMPNMNEEQKDKLKRSIKEAYEGIHKAHKTMVLWGGMTIDQFGINQKDMDFLEQQKFSRDKILGIFRVPKAIVAQTEGVNLASAKVADVVFSKYTIQPKLQRLEEQLNEFLVPMFAKSENLFLKFDNPVPEDLEEKDKHFQTALSSGWLTVNEVRMENGYPSVKGGDEIRVPAQFIPIGKPLDEAKKIIDLYNVKARLKAKGIGDKKIEKVANELRNQIKEMLLHQIEDDNLERDKQKKLRIVIRNKIKNVIKKNLNEEKGKEDVIELTSEKKLEFWKINDKISENYIPKVKKDMIEVFVKQEKEVIKSLKTELKDKKTVKAKEKVNMDNIILDPAEQIKITLSATMPELEKLFKESGDETFEFIGVSGEIDLNNDDVRKLLNSEGRRFSKEVTETTNLLIREELVQGLALKESIADLTKRIKNVFTDATDVRAEMIARTETIRFNNAGIEQSFIDSEVIEAKIWTTNPGACPICLAIEATAEPVALGEDFFKKGDSIEGFTFNYNSVKYPPAHPNCKCVLAPVFKGNDEIDKRDDEIFYDFFDSDGKLRKIVKPYKNLSQSETIAVRMYTEKHYGIINNYLRTGKVPTKMSEEKIKHLIKVMNKGISKLKETKGIFYRGIEIDTKNLFSEGKIFQDNGFLSTSSDINIAKTFGGELNEKVILEIKGNGIQISELSNIKQEKEFLFNMNSKFKVVKVEDLFFDDRPKLKHIKVILEEIVEDRKTISDDSKFMLALQKGETKHKNSLIK